MNLTNRAPQAFKACSPTSTQDSLEATHREPMSGRTLTAPRGLDQNRSLAGLRRTLPTVWLAVRPTLLRRLPISHRSTSCHQRITTLDAPDQYTRALNGQQAALERLFSTGRATYPRLSMYYRNRAASGYGTRKCLRNNRITYVAMARMNLINCISCICSLGREGGTCGYI